VGLQLSLGTVIERSARDLATARGAASPAGGGR
jgi:hypothetical protein